MIFSTIFQFEWSTGGWPSPPSFSGSSVVPPTGDSYARLRRHSYFSRMFFWQSNGKVRKLPWVLNQLDVLRESAILVSAVFIFHKDFIIAVPGRTLDTAYCFPSETLRFSSGCGALGLHCTVLIGLEPIIARPVKVCPLRVAELSPH
jgi:hypothetical protein